MGWEVFHQVTLIPIPIYLMKLMSKKEGNCNVIITRFVDHELYMVLLRELNPQPIRDLSTLSFNPQRLRYELFFTLSHCCYNLISLIPTWPPISTSSFWSKSLTRHRLLTDQRFFGSGDNGARTVSSRFIKKNH